jgi:hypothetical protein
MTTTEINRQLHEALGKYWFKHCPQENPDYCADPRLVIEAMRRRDEDKDFLVDIVEKNNRYPPFFIVDLIMDKTGRLANLAIEWLETREVGDGL